jgi:hypothetical protein
MLLKVFKEKKHISFFFTNILAQTAIAAWVRNSSSLFLLSFNELKFSLKFLKKFFVFYLAGRLERPSPPVLVASNHHSIELEWEHVRTQDQTRSRHRRIFDESGSAHSGSLIYLQQREKRSGSIWESIYTYVYENIYLIEFIFYEKLEDQH